eukprot:PhF_6_TR29291/c0_g1_i4/m.42929
MGSSCSNVTTLNNSEEEFLRMKRASVSPQQPNNTITSFQAINPEQNDNNNSSSNPTQTRRRSHHRTHSIGGGGGVTKQCSHRNKNSGGTGGTGGAPSTNHNKLLFISAQRGLDDLHPLIHGANGTGSEDDYDYDHDSDSKNKDGMYPPTLAKVEGGVTSEEEETGDFIPSPPPFSPPHMVAGQLPTSPPRTLPVIEFFPPPIQFTLPAFARPQPQQHSLMTLDANHNNQENHITTTASSSLSSGGGDNNNNNTKAPPQWKVPCYAVWVSGSQGSQSRSGDFNGLTVGSDDTRSDEGRSRVQRVWSWMSDVPVFDATATMSSSSSDQQHFAIAKMAGSIGKVENEEEDGGPRELVKSNTQN